MRGIPSSERALVAQHRSNRMLSASGISLLALKQQDEELFRANETPRSPESNVRGGEGPGEPHTGGDHSCDIPLGTLDWLRLIAPCEVTRLAVGVLAVAGRIGTIGLRPFRSECPLFEPTSHES